MKTKSTPVKHAAIAALLLGIAPALVAESSMDKRNHDARSTDADRAYQNPSASDQIDRATTNRLASQDSRGRPASELLGQNVYGTGDESLGELKDFVVDTQSGKITYAVVSSGGILGINQSLRAVPIDSFQVSGDRLSVNLDETRWKQAPVFTKEQVGTLSQEARGKELREFYGLKDSMFSSPNGPLALITDIRGKEVRAGDQTVGEIDEIIVQVQSHKAAALLDPNDDYAGTDREFLIPLKKLANYGQDDLSTTLTREDFTQAGQSYGATDTRSTDLGDSIQAWGAAAGAGIREGSDRVADATDRTADRLGDRADGMTRNTAGQPPVDAIRRAVQADARAAGVQTTVNVVAAEDKVILQGTVPTKAVKERIEERAESAAQGWDVESELRVASTQ